MKIRRRTIQCHNCGHTLGQVYNYCPNCGQENSDSNISFGKLLKEFIHNYFSLDSKFRNSLKPFLVSPGFITKEFISGKRVSYANPVRLYLVMSLLYFFMLSIVNSYFSSDKEETISVINRSSKDSVLVESVTGIPSDRVDEEDDDGVFGKLDWNLMDSLKWDKSVSNRSLLDTMNLDLPFIDRRIALQTIKLYRTNTAQFKDHILRNLPIMMVFIVPLFGVILKWFFRQKKGFYIQHLIHSLHLHSFSYLTYSVAIILILVIPEATVVVALGVIAFLWVSIYFFKSMRAIYKKSFLGTLWRLFASGLLYQLLLVVFLTLLMTISFVLF